MAGRSQKSQGEGNTNPRPRRVCFTLNNYTETDLIELQRIFAQKGANWLWGRERGESGTPHIQGYAEFRNQVAFDTMKEWNKRIHWEKARGSRAANVAYCSKEGQCEGPLKPFIPRDPLTGLALYPWQEDIMALLDTVADDRTVHWYWEPHGGRGKSALVKHICITRKGVLVVSGKAADIGYAIYTYCTNNGGHGPAVVIVDIPRCNIDHVSVQAIESVKNGLLFSTKYESGQCIFDTPHVIIFANFPPPIETMSQDRWHIVEIDGT